MFAWPVRILPKTLYLDNYHYLFSEYPFFRWYWNTILTTVIRTAITVFFSALAGFAFAKYDFRLKRPLFLLVLISIMLPFQVLLTPLFIEMAAFKWLDTYQGVIVPLAVSAFFIFLMRQYMLGVPDELMDAARIDGCSEFGILLKIIMPLAMPAVVTMIAFQFIWIWNTLVWGLALAAGTSRQPIMAGILRLKGAHAIAWNIQSAGALISTILPLAVFLGLQKYLYEGLVMEAGIKG